MASYNFMKRADRDRCRKARRLEIASVGDKTWPRDRNDAMRWGATKTFADSQERAEHAKAMCEAEVAYLDDLDRRIATGDPDLRGYQS